MCIQIIFGGDTISTVGELKALCPVIEWEITNTDLPFDKVESDGWCLCSVDYEETAKNNGFSAEMDSSYMFIIFERIPPDTED